METWAVVFIVVLALTGTGACVAMLVSLMLLLNDSMMDHYVHAREHCGCGPVRALWRAWYAETTGRWPW